MLGHNNGHIIVGHYGEYNGPLWAHYVPLCIPVELAITGRVKEKISQYQPKNPHKQVHEAET